MTHSAASGAETSAEPPASRAKTAPPPIARLPARSRPKRCATTLPVSETAMPSSPATVKIALGPGSHAGAPCQAMEGARKVTPQARSAASSQLWTV